MKKLFISQPMKGKTDEAIKEERQQAIREAEQAVGEPVEVIDSFFEGGTGRCKAVVVFGKIAGTARTGRHCIFRRGMAGCEGMSD
jgi:hypothetical protein